MTHSGPTAFALVAFTCCLSATYGQGVFNDGGEHVLSDSYVIGPDELFSVGNQTTVHWRGNAEHPDVVFNGIAAPMIAVDESH